MGVAVDRATSTETISHTVDILGVSVHLVDKFQLLATVAGWTNQTERRTIMYVNANCLNLANTDTEYRGLLNQADLVYADGVGAVWAGKFLYRCNLFKATGRDWIRDFCLQAEKDGIKLYILAGAPGIADRAAEKLLQEYPALQIVGCSDGFFQAESEAQVLERIDQTAPQVVFCGMGAPVQERWMTRYRQEINAPVCWGVGALFDYLAGKEAQVPGWLDRAGLEWLWRLYVDPLGKWRRYLLGIPLFVVRIWKQKMGLRST